LKRNTFFSLFFSTPPNTIISINESESSFHYSSLFCLLYSISHHAGRNVPF
jgi:hypothetical protein